MTEYKGTPVVWKLWGGMVGVAPGLPGSGPVRREQRGWASKAISDALYSQLGMTVHYAKVSPARPDWLGGGQWIINDLRDVSVLFGRNGSGKSLLLRALNEEPEPSGTFYASPERAGEISYDQSLMQQELIRGNRGENRKGSNLAANYRRESVSRIATMVQVIGQRAGRGEPVHQKRILEKLERHISELLPEFIFTYADEQPFFKLDRIGPGSWMRSASPTRQPS
jgi:hypothetical protein